MRKLKNLEYVVYQGQEFLIEWYYDSNNKSPALEYFETLADDDKESLLVLVKVFGDRGKIFNTEKFRNEGDKIFAFKPKPNRFLCFFAEGKKIIITNGFYKNQNKLPPTEKERALTYRKEYLRRIKEGIYYEK
ncbi:type II toxin-antitoxin system RelE/ParE family toxin [Leptospira stimsonii]|uniref:Type II toxin-antitoxin system RelE/ParE family toxin n=1 Tax=Leptospira stimsonii TaxID=2202203 RepID=A0A8B3CHJ8_9LEPT|nr:type II toxin-antitoxin system RelE/ParE family toxin [Leptospira stimsonii]RHX83206.1 hypothetical protein DLM78_22115 [Leptospira stimsonii]